MNLIKKGRRILVENGYTFVALKKDEIYSSTLHGIKPLMSKIFVSNAYFKDYVVIDRVIGRAAALLLIRSKVKYIHGFILSEPAKDLLEQYNPTIIVITGHDAYYKSKDSYKNSDNFVSAVKEARKYEKSHQKLVIIAGACQSNYEDLIKAGATFASSPKRINIHALDPAIIATKISLTCTNDSINLRDLLNKTKYGSEGIGGLQTNGMMYVGFPR